MVSAGIWQCVSFTLLKAAVWGAHPKIEGSSDIRGLDVSQRLHPVFEDFHDVILLIDEGVKPVSSTAGHALMDGHVFGKARIQQAFDHVEEMMEILHAGNIDRFNELSAEAPALHALMMSAADPYLLMRPGTPLKDRKVSVDSGKRQKTQVCFTLDAGANLHLLFPAASEQKVMPWVENALSKVSGGRYICDCVGMTQMEFSYMKVTEEALFYAKILLFGEYGIIKDSMGLSIPYHYYEGSFDTLPNFLLSNRTRATNTSGPTPNTSAS